MIKEVTYNLAYRPRPIFILGGLDSISEVPLGL